MSDTNNRSCAECAYCVNGPELPSYDEGIKTESLFCYHDPGIALPVFKHRFCSKFWDRKYPLPTPWLDYCPHGSSGFCSACLHEAIWEGLAGK